MTDIKRGSAARIAGGADSKSSRATSRVVVVRDSGCDSRDDSDRRGVRESGRVVGRVVAAPPSDVMTSSVDAASRELSQPLTKNAINAIRMRF